MQCANIASVYGNTDDWILGRQTPPAPLQPLCDWTSAQLTAVQRTWLDSLPFSQHCSPTESAEDALLVVHANPQDVNQLVFPPEAEQEAKYGRLRQPDSALEALFANITPKVIVYGHLHVPSVRQLGRFTLANISSVNMAGDGDARAKYGLFSWDGSAWQLELRRVTYDAQNEMDAYRQMKPPGWENFVAQIEQHGCVPQNV